MPLRVLIIPDKFKGTLSAIEAAEAIARGWKSARPEDCLELLPMSDGGDGFGEVLGAIWQAVPKTTKTVNAAHEPCHARWWWAPDKRIAIIESAKVIGLAMLPRGRYHPFELDTWGLGNVLRAASRCGAKRCFLGIGGSATNDAGFGMARALGWRFLDAHGAEITTWPKLAGLKRIEPPAQNRLFSELIVATDVRNRLLGVRGCTRIYGPQKGLRPDDFPVAEAALRLLSTVARRLSGRNLGAVPGAGAAGGLGFGLMMFLGAKIQHGFDVFARNARLTERMRHCQLVITGEGELDGSSIMGKGPGEIARLCQNLQIPCIALAGSITGSSGACKVFAKADAITRITSLENALKRPAYWLEKLAKITAATFLKA